jgi:hypothetical protein
VAPPLIGKVPDSSRFSEEFEGANEKSRKLGPYFKEVAMEYACKFLDASEVVKTSEVDGIHLDVDQHIKLGHSIAEKVLEILK